MNSKIGNRLFVIGDRPPSYNEYETIVLAVIERVANGKPYSQTIHKVCKNIRRNKLDLAAKQLRGTVGREADALWEVFAARECGYWELLLQRAFSLASGDGALLNEVISNLSKKKG
jgi:hypothetical protein